ncbi:MAG TPA: twin-arginine translocase subunit TatC [Fimbriimonas sp.]
MGALHGGPSSRRSIPDDPEEFRLTLVEHLEELRDRIVRILVFVTVGWVVGWFAEPYLYTYLNKMVEQAVVPVLGPGHEWQEVFHNTTEPFMLKLKLSFYIGLILSLPLVLNELWGFVAPGLHKNERRPFTRLIPAMFFLFIIGVVFSWLVMPQALAWFAGYVNEFPGVNVNQEAGTMVFFVLKMLIAFGVAFQLPLVVYGLGALDLLSAETLMSYWRQAATVIFLLAAVITPSNDPISMLMMAIPLVVLFMISVYLVKLTQKKRKKLKAAVSEALE